MTQQTLNQNGSSASPPAAAAAAAAFQFQSQPSETVIPAAHGYAEAVKAGTIFRLIDLHGLQVIDMSAFVLPFTYGAIASAEHLSPSYTLHHTNGTPIAIGEPIYTNMDRPLLRLVGDTVKTHDMTFMSCFPHMYESRGLKGHRSCAQNMVEALSGFGMKGLTEVREPFNVFQNTPYFAHKQLNCSRPGDWVEFEVLLDCVIAWSCCPFDQNNWCGERPTCDFTEDLSSSNGSRTSSNYIVLERRTGEHDALRRSLDARRGLLDIFISLSY